nr:family 6 glucosyltransferase [Parabacteroides goldsteinii]
MKIGILYICTGTYEFFWKSFYQSAERYFFQGSPWIREYFVFTDHSSIYGEDENEHIHRIYQENLGWPGNTMKRFDMFLRIRELLEKVDYLFFFNANMEFLVSVGEEILPSKANNGMVGALHSWFFDQHRWNYPYERRRLSAAYIPYWKGKHYFQGSLLGGTTTAFLNMCEICKQWIDKDLSNNIIPIWHDESIINKYYLLYPPKILDCRYNYCELRSLPIENKIFYKDKTQYFSFNDLKRPSYTVYPEMPGRKIVKGLNFIERIWTKFINK